MSTTKQATTQTRTTFRVIPGSRAGQPVRRAARAAGLALVSAAPWTIAARLDPKRKMLHDFRDAMQALVYAVERADGDAVAGLGNCLECYLLEALYGGKMAA